MLAQARQRWLRHRLKDPAYAFLLEPDTSGEVVSIDCETTSLDVKRAEILSIAAIRIRGNRILSSERLELVVRASPQPGDQSVLIHHLRPVDVARGVPVDEAIARILHFIGSRPLVGYYLEFDVAILNKYVRPRLGVSLPNRQIDVSGLYYDAKYKRMHPGSHIDLRFSTIREALDLPERAEHDAFNDALLAAMMYLRLTGPGAGLA